MKREIKVTYPNGAGEYTVTIGDLYTVKDWNQRAFFRLINVDRVIATIATVKYGKTHEVGVHELIPYTPKKQYARYWRKTGKF